jgi:tartrate-resistant acid phosphatase type 5
MNYINWIKKFRFKRFVAHLHLRHLVILLLFLFLFVQACNPSVQADVSPIVTSTQEARHAIVSTPPQKPSLTTPLQSTLQPTGSLSSIPTIPYTTSPLVFAVIGDYGDGEAETGELSKMMESWHPEFIITVGDNNYPIGAADHIDTAIGQFFHQYIYPYQGKYGEGADINRFFPTLGNHDIKTDNGQPYFDYFTLPGNERYYDFVWGPVHFYAIDTTVTEPDGYNASSIQAAWLQERLLTSTSPWNIVYGHYPPYSSGLHGSTEWAHWPFSEWGVDAVLSGHDHDYERLLVDGVTYIVNGVGGSSLYNFNDVLTQSQVRYNDDFGAVRAEATDDTLLFQFFNRTGELIDEVELRK